MRSRMTVLYAMLGTGVALGFFGHGVLGAKGEEKFVGLVTGTYDEVLGGTMSTDTATSLVNVIGWLDIALSVIFVGLVVAALRNRREAYSRVAMWLFGWAALWGFLTALSRFTAEINGKNVWDVVERGPNYLLPAGLVYLIYKMRQSSAASVRTPERAETNGRAEARAPAATV